MCFVYTILILIGRHVVLDLPVFTRKVARMKRAGNVLR